MRLLSHPAWPHIRAALVAFHVASLVILSLPSAGAIGDERRWNTANARADLDQLAQRLRGWGFDTNADRVRADLWNLSRGYLQVQKPLAAPFAAYAKATGSRQGWSMFASPQRHPAELHVDIERDGTWVPVYRPHSDEHDWNRAQFEHNRFRKFLGRFARGFIRRDYREAARWVATKAAREHPDATRVRVQLYRYRSLPPDAVRAGAKPRGHYEHPMRFDAEALR